MWACWDAAAPPFLEYLGEFRRFLDLILDGWDGREGQAELLGGVQKWIIPCNWKWPAENFTGDTYHNISHRSVDLVGAGPSGRSRRDYGELNVARRLHVAIPDRGHQTITYVLPKDHQPQPAYQNSPEVAEYFRHCEEERRRRPGVNSRMIGAPGEIFPNVALLPRQPRTLAVWHPVNAHQTEVWRFFFVDRDAPRAVKNFLRDYYIRYSGPAGMTEQDDMENWNYAHCRQPGRDRAAVSLHLRNGHGPRGRGLRMGRAADARPGGRPDQGAWRARSRCGTCIGGGRSSWRPTVGTN